MPGNHSGRYRTVNRLSMHSRQKILERSITGRDNVHQVHAGSCKESSYGHGFLRQFNKRVIVLLGGIPIGHLENDGANGASDGG